MATSTIKRGMTTAGDLNETVSAGTEKMISFNTGLSGKQSVVAVTNYGVAPVTAINTNASGVTNLYVKNNDTISLNVIVHWIASLHVGGGNSPIFKYCPSSIALRCAA